MRQRRRDQPQVQALTHTARFLTNLCASGGVTQAELAKKLQDQQPRDQLFGTYGTSAATVSRWFRGTAVPTDDDFKRLGALLKVPVENFFAIRALEDAAARKQHQISSIAAWHYLTSCPGEILFLGGITMIGGLAHLRSAKLENRTIVLSLLKLESVIAREQTYDGFESGSMCLCWLAVVQTCITLVRRTQSARLCLWTREDDPVGSEPEVGHLVANDWVAIETKAPDSPTFAVTVRGDARWQTFIAPLMEQLRSGAPAPGQHLLLDTAWATDDPRRRQFEKYRDQVLASLRTKLSAKDKRGAGAK